jgi:hypothetical protein
VGEVAIRVDDHVVQVAVRTGEGLEGRIRRVAHVPDADPAGVGLLVDGVDDRRVVQREEVVRRPGVRTRPDDGLSEGLLVEAVVDDLEAGFAPSRLR